MIRGRHEAERIASSEVLSNDEIKQCVNELLDPRSWQTAQLRLKHQGRRIVPFVIEAMTDERYKAKLYGESILAGRPFFVLLELIEPYAAAESIPILAPLVAHADRDVRSKIALALGALGSDECVPFLKAALADVDADVRSYAIIGIGRAVTQKCATPVFCDGVFESVAACISLHLIPSDASSCLLEIDRERATKFLLSDQYWGSVNDDLAEITKALNNAKVSIPFDKLTKLLIDLKPVMNSYPHYRTYGQVLLAMAALGNPDSEKFISEGIDSENEHVSDESAKAICRLRGVSDPHSFVFELWEKSGFERLNKPQQSFALVSTFDGEVNNGGYEQFYFNSAGNYALQTVDALSTVGASTTAELLRRTNALFGTNGPSSDRAIRHRQLSVVADRIEEVLAHYRKEAGSQFKPDRIHKLVYLFVAEHSDEFH